MDLVVFTYEQAKTLFLITEEEAIVLALQAPKEYEVPPPTRLMRVDASFVRQWQNHQRQQRYLGDRELPLYLGQKLTWYQEWR